MTCPHCDELRERIAYLEGELGLQKEATHLAAIRAFTHGVTIRGRMQTAEFILALYRANGRVISGPQLMEIIPPHQYGEDDRNHEIVKVWAHGARKILGRQAIQTVWGRGYRLTAEGLERVRDIIASALNAGDQAVAA